MQSSPFCKGDQSFAHQDCDTGCEVQAEGMRREITTYRVSQDYQISVVARCNTQARKVVCVDVYCLSTVIWLCSLLCSALPHTDTKETTLCKDIRNLRPLQRDAACTGWQCLSLWQLNFAYVDARLGAAAGYACVWQTSPSMTS